MLPKIAEKLKEKSVAIVFSKSSVAIAKSRDLDIHVGNILKESFALLNKNAGGRDNFGLAKLDNLSKQKVLEVLKESVIACLK